MTIRPIVDHDTVYPWTPWHSVRQQIDHMWDPENAAHHAIIGLTRSGKSYLAVHGILDLCKYDRVLIVDTKGDDHTTQVGKPVQRLPKNAWYQNIGKREDQPYQEWFRLVAPDNRAKATDLIGEALNRVYDEGEWVVYIDELWEVTGHGSEGLGLDGIMSKLWRKGGYRHVSVVAATQSPVAVPRLFYDQAAFAWIGRIRDEDRQRRLLEIGGLTKADLPVLATLKRREWLLAADNGEYFARTTVDTGPVT